MCKRVRVQRVGWRGVHVAAGAKDGVQVGAEGCTWVQRCRWVRGAGGCRGVQGGADACRAVQVNVRGCTPTLPPPQAMACLHETRTPSPSLAVASEGTPEQELTPTQCALREGPPPIPAAPEAWPRRGPPRAAEPGAAGPLAAEGAHLRCQAAGGFLEGLFGCLKPVWSMIGKAYSAEHKHPAEGEELGVLRDGGAGGGWGCEGGQGMQWGWEDSMIRMRWGWGCNRDAVGLQ